MTSPSRELLENKHIKEVEGILSELASYSRIPGTLSINDVAHAFFLMKVFVVYPKNYGQLRFDDPATETELRF